MKRSGKFNILFSVLFVISSLLQSRVALAGTRTQVIVNKSVLVNLKNPVARISIANPAISDMILISPLQIQLNGLTLGSTSLIVWEKGVEKPLFFDVNVVNDAKIEESRQVLLQVKVVQVDRTALKNMGISVLVKGSSAEGVVSAASDNNVGTLLGNAASLTGLPTEGVQLGVSYFKGGIGATLKALATKGYAKILAEPNLLVKSRPPGKSGSGSSTSRIGDITGCSASEGYACFLAGQKYPISIVQSVNGTSQTTVQTLDIGVKLVFNAEVLESGLINLIISPASVSALSGSLAVNGYPIIDTREVNTEVELEDGQSLIIAGLLQEEAIKTMSKIPFFGDIPILGALFRATDDNIKEKELVFFVTPKIIKPANTANESKFVVKDGQKYELPGEKLPIGFKESDIKVSPEQERDIKWIPTIK
jgi:pilus assembly protein CpaC